MRFRNLLATTLTGVTLLVVPSVASAQSCVDFSEVKPNGKLTQVFSSSALTDHVSFFFWAVAGRSYSVEVQNVARNYLAGGFSMNVNPTGGCPTSNMAGLNNTSAVEPTPNPGDPLSFSRFSFTATSTGFIDFRAGATSGTVQLQASVSDTTLFSNWFFLGGDYAAFTLLRNTTSSPVVYTINWRNSSGAIVGSSSGTLTANASIAINGGTIPGAVTAVSGTVEIVHNSTLGAIVANTDRAVRHDRAELRRDVCRAALNASASVFSVSCVGTLAV